MTVVAAVCAQAEPSGVATRVLDNLKPSSPAPDAYLPQYSDPRKSNLGSMAAAIKKQSSTKAGRLSASLSPSPSLPCQMPPVVLPVEGLPAQRGR